MQRQQSSSLELAAGVAEVGLVTLEVSGHEAGSRRKRPALRRISPTGIECARAFHAAAHALCLSDCYNLILHKHLGDVVNTLAAKSCFEERYGAKLRFLVRPQHEFLMRMYGVEDYALLDIDGLVKRNIDLQNIFFGDIKPPPKDLDHLENHLFQTLFPCVPIEGTPFICENITNDFFAYDRYWAFRWAANMGIEDCRLSLPSCTPQLSHHAKLALAAVAPLPKIVLFAPEAATAQEFDLSFWNILADLIHSQGYTIVVNSKRITLRHGVSAFAMDLDLADVVALGYACAYVFSMRSGLCDALVGIGERLYAFYPAMLRREGYGLCKAFRGAPNVREICISEWIVDSWQWEGIDCTPLLQDYVNKLRQQHRRTVFIKSLPFKKNDPKVHSLLHKLELWAGSPIPFMETNTENMARDQVSTFIGIPVKRKSFHYSQEEGKSTRRSIMFGLVVVTEWADGSWKSFFLNLPVSSFNAMEKRYAAVEEKSG